MFILCISSNKSNSCNPLTGHRQEEGTEKWSTSSWIPSISHPLMSGGTKLSFGWQMIGPLTVTAPRRISIISWWLDHEVLLSYAWRLLSYDNLLYYYNLRSGNRSLEGQCKSPWFIIPLLWLCLSDSRFIELILIPDVKFGRYHFWSDLDLNVP